MTNRRPLIALLFAAALGASRALSLGRNPKTTSRLSFVRETVVGAFGASIFASAAVVPAPANADSALAPKRKNISDAELKKIITADIVERSFLVSANLSREVYDESSTFTDEIDTYTIDKWIKGTQKLFVAEKSRVDLVGDVQVSPTKVEFRFDEDLMFRIPLRPVVTLTGKLVLDRDPETGLITKYQEFWVQDVKTVLKSVKFN